MLKKAGVLACAGLSAILLRPATASAQHAHVVVHGGVAVHGGFYYPYYYRPYFYPYYSPFYFGIGAFWGGFYAGYGGYPYYAGYPYPYPYPPYYYSGAWASARIEVKPRDAQVYLDGYYVGVVDQFDGTFQRLDIPGGEHELTVYMPGYHTLRERSVFRPGQTYHYKETLQPLASGEAPDPKPQPDPNAAPQNAPESYPAPPQRSPYGQPPPGQPPYGQPPYGQPPYGQPPQEPPPPPAQQPQGGGRMDPMPRGAQNQPGDFGTLNLRVQPEDAAVTIDGQRWDSPEGGARLTVQLAPGPHHIEVRKDGFKTYTSTVQIRPGESQTLNISLPSGD